MHFYKNALYHLTQQHFLVLNFTTHLVSIPDYFKEMLTKTSVFEETFDKRFLEHA